MKDNYLIAIVVHDKQDHSNALVVTDFMTKKEYEMFDKSALSTFIDPSRVPKETTTSAIVASVFNSDQVNFNKYTILGVIREH